MDSEKQIVDHENNCFVYCIVFYWRKNKADAVEYFTQPIPGSTGVLTVNFVLTQYEFIGKDLVYEA